MSSSFSVRTYYLTLYWPVNVFGSASLSSVEWSLMASLATMAFFDFQFRASTACSISASILSSIRLRSLHFKKKKWRRHTHTYTQKALMATNIEGGAWCNEQITSISIPTLFSLAALLRPLAALRGQPFAQTKTGDTEGKRAVFPPLLTFTNSSFCRAKDRRPLFSVLLFVKRAVDSASHSFRTASSALAIQPRSDNHRVDSQSVKSTRR